MFKQLKPIEFWVTELISKWKTAESIPFHFYNVIHVIQLIWDKQSATPDKEKMVKGRGSGRGNGIILLCGIPGSGKSHMSKLLMEALLDTSDVSVIHFDNHEISRGLKKSFRLRDLVHSSFFFFFLYRSFFLSFFHAFSLSSLFYKNLGASFLSKILVSKDWTAFEHG